MLGNIINTLYNKILKLLHFFKSIMTENLLEMKVVSFLEELLLNKIAFYFESNIYIFITLLD